jgi:hypothetical protein
MPADGLASHLSAAKLGVALCGLGNYARGQLAPALKLTQNCELRGVVTGSPEKGGAWAKEYGFPQKNIYHYDTMARLAENPDIDIVYVVTPNALHAQHVIGSTLVSRLSRARPLVERHGTGNTSRICADRRPARARRERCGGQTA